ncbi:MAG: hypothetical protein KY440_00325 [Actinobacteria bacterium]|nr:hypothetical protein [Actinomycetota bacterium]
MALRGGLCLLGGGSAIGLVLAGVCTNVLPELPVPSLPPLPPLVEGLPLPEPPEVELPPLPTGPPDGLGRLIVRVRLVD